MQTWSPLTEDGNAGKSQAPSTITVKRASLFSSPVNRYTSFRCLFCLPMLRKWPIRIFSARLQCSRNDQLEDYRSVTTVSHAIKVTGRDNGYQEPLTAKKKTHSRINYFRIFIFILLLCIPPSSAWIS